MEPLPFLIDGYLPNSVTGINTNLIRATATPLPEPNKPDQWQVIFKTNPLSQVNQQRLFAGRELAVAGLCEVLATF